MHILFQIQTQARNNDPRIGSLNSGKSEWCSKIKMAVVLAQLRAVSRNGTLMIKNKQIKMAYLQYWQNKNAQELE